MGTALATFAVLEEELMHTEEITGVWYGPPWGHSNSASCGCRSHEGKRSFSAMEDAGRGQPNADLTSSLTERPCY